MSNTSQLTKDEIIPYLEYKNDELFDIAYNMINYCERYNPLLIKYGNISDIIEILEKYIDFPNPFILKEDPAESEEDEYDDTY